MNETDGTVTMIVRIFEGMISEEKSIPVRFTTADDSAQGIKECKHLGITLTSSIISQLRQIT